jgi:DNA polymerase I-like protein with 3'-5' exonuclease and polymerase domains
MLALDSETTGVDFHHGAEPFLVTFCDKDWNNTWYEWDVDPLTRKVQVPKDDIEEIATAIEEAELLILQNAKFDATALKTVLPKNFEWPWERTHDTLFSGHLLASNHAHDLTSMSIEYLGIDPAKYENHLYDAVAACRRLVNKKDSPIGNWRIAQEGLPEMPSAKKSTKRDEDKPWKFDLWLPRAVVKWCMEHDRLELVPGLEEAVDNDEEHPWLTLTSTYANVDSATTLGVHLRHVERMQERGLMPLYEERLNLIPVVHDMEGHGVTASGPRLEELYTDYKEGSATAGAICVNIAADYDHELVLPKAGNNRSLTDFVFKKMKLPAVKRSKKTNEPSLNAKVVEAYQVTLEPRSKELLFINSLSGKRKRDTALQFMTSYKKFWLPNEFKDFYTIFASVNPTGTDTLRFAAYNPNEQNISKKEGFNLRYIFGPAPGREWWSLDAKNIELRLPAYESGEQELIDLFERPDDPPYYGSTHLLNFHTVYPDIWDKELQALEKDLIAEFGPRRVAEAKEAALAKVGPWCKKKFASTWYQYCKNGGFAVQYGAVEREEGTADQAFHRAGSHTLLKARFNNLEKLNQYWINYANKWGYVETMPDFSICDRGYPLLCTRSQWGGILPTVPLNYHIQSTACWWMCRAMVRCHAQLIKWRKEGFYAYIAMNIHDELVFDFPKGGHPVKDKENSNLAKVEVLAGLMELGGTTLHPVVPTPVGIEYNEFNWSEGITIK